MKLRVPHHRSIGRTAKLPAGPEMGQRTLCMGMTLSTVVPKATLCRTTCHLGPIATTRNRREEWPEERSNSPLLLAPCGALGNGAARRRRNRPTTEISRGAHAPREPRLPDERLQPSSTAPIGNAANWSAATVAVLIPTFVGQTEWPDRSTLDRNGIGGCFKHPPAPICGPLGQTSPS